MVIRLQDAALFVAKKFSVSIVLKPPDIHKISKEYSKIFQIFWILFNNNYCDHNGLLALC